jgi:U3 small nucleolar ribonucleoprotein protein IMP3
VRYADYVYLVATHRSSLPKAVKFIEQGHVRVGPDTITDPAYLVTRWAFPGIAFLVYSQFTTVRHMEDFVTWVDTSKLKRTIMQYNDQVRLPLSRILSLD